MIVEVPVEINWLLVAGYVLLSYLLGAIPTGYLVVKKLTGEDIRKHGSGGTGATNVKRVAGNDAARLVLFLDLFKGLLPVLVARLWVLPGFFEVHLLVAFAAIIGHSRSVFLGFSGGKSAATGLGTLFGMSPIAGILVGLLAFCVIRITRVVSLGSLAAAVCTPVIIFALGDPLPYIVYGLVSAVYVIYLHRENIGRLLKGTENKLE